MDVTLINRILNLVHSAVKKPFTAVTVQIEHLTSEQYEVDDSSGIIDLIEVIRIQASGPTEASRALRKKLYVDVDVPTNYPDYI